MATIDAFLTSLRDLGYVEGRSLTIDWRFADGQDDRLVGLAEELVSLQPDVIVASARGVATARQVTSTIPIVSAQAGDLVGTGLAASLAHPGGNVTGLTTLAPQLAGKRLELLKAALPAVSRVGVVWNPREPGMVLEINQAQTAAALLGLELRSFQVGDASEIVQAFETALSERLDAVLTVSSIFFARNRTRLVEVATTSRVPTMSGDPDFARSGGLLAYGPSNVEQFRRAAGFVDKIIKGASPADLPIEQPTTLDFVVNLTTARALGLTIPQPVLSQATEVIQ